MSVFLGVFHKNTMKIYVFLRVFHKFTCKSGSKDIPKSTRKAAWPKCGCCAAQFFLATRDLVPAPRAGAVLEMLSASAQVTAELQTLAQMHEQGHLDGEFKGKSRRTVRRAIEADINTETS